METPTHHRRFPVLAFLSVAFLSVALPSALQAQEAVAAQQPAAAPAATPQVIRQIPEEKLAQYAAAYMEIADVRERINAEFARTGNKIPEAQEELQKQRLEAIGGVVPKLIAPPPGCRFAPRCKHATRECTLATTELVEVEPGHRVACIHWAALA